ncbi:MAG TPA: hypothetical protein VIX85_09465 [Acidimicrobiales bacterium]
MADDGEDGGRLIDGEGAERRLLIPYDSASPSPFLLGEAARGLCRPIWVVDLDEPEMTEVERLLRKFGVVVNTSGMEAGQLVEALSATDPTGIMALNDRRTVLLAEVAARLDLDFHSRTVAERLTDKKLQRQVMRDAGLPVPPFLILPDGIEGPEAERLARAMHFPAVLKPRQGGGSRNVIPVADTAELGRIFETSPWDRTEESGWILEGFLRNAEPPASRFSDVVSVESFLHAGTIHHLAVTGRFSFADPFRETGSILPSDLSPDDRLFALGLAATALTVLEVRHGCHHTEIKFTPDGPSVLEVNGRIGGGVPELLSLATGRVSVLRLAMELALGMPPSVELPLSFPRIAYRRVAPPPISATRITAMSGQDDLSRVPGVDAVTINRGPGDAVDWRRGFGQMVYSVYGTADDYDEVDSAVRRIDAAVSISYD